MSVDSKLVKFLMESPMNHPESWAVDDDDDFAARIADCDLYDDDDELNPDLMQEIHEYFGIGPIGRNGPLEPLDEDEIIDYLEENPDKIELFTKLMEDYVNE